MSIKRLLASATILAAGLSTTTPALADSDPYLGEVMIVGFTFCPRGWADASGQILPINQNQSLYSLYGTTFGGDGRTTFALPRMRGRIPIGNDGSNGTMGQLGGSETNTMTAAQMPSHTHQAGVQTTNVAANSPNPASDAFGIATSNTYVDGAAPNQNFMNAGTVTIGNKGGGQAQNNMMPTLALRYCVALQGIFPSRN